MMGAGVAWPAKPALTFFVRRTVYVSHHAWFLRMTPFVPDPSVLSRH